MHLTNPGIQNFIHPTGGESVGRALNELRKESLDVYNRLHSIEEDISFVNEVHKAYPGFPILRKPHKLQRIRTDIHPTIISKFAVWCMVYRSTNCQS